MGIPEQLRALCAYGLEIRFCDENLLAHKKYYYAMQEAELRRTEQVQINGAMQRQQNAIRSSQQISRTLSETSDIVNQAYWDRS